MPQIKRWLGLLPRKNGSNASAAIRPLNKRLGATILYAYVAPSFVMHVV
jgi:hypothetical protein